MEVIRVEPGLIYLNDHPDLLAKAPCGFPHLLDIARVDETIPHIEFSIVDIAVTVLYKYRPQSLKAFLDLDCAEIHFLRRQLEQS